MFDVVFVCLCSFSLEFFLLKNIAINGSAILGVNYRIQGHLFPYH